MKLRTISIAVSGATLATAVVLLAWGGSALASGGRAAAAPRPFFAVALGLVAAVGAAALPAAVAGARRRRRSRVNQAAEVSDAPDPLSPVPPPRRRRHRAPPMPEPYIAHVLPATAGFLGRAGERAALSKWLRAKSAPPIRVLTGPGGAGKSALARLWMERDVLRRELPGVAGDDPDARKRTLLPPRFRPDGVMWWSFDRPGSSFSVFLDEAIAYFTSGAVAAGGYLASRSEKVNTLIGLLRDGTFLLVLDGFERELRAFATLGAAYQGDACVETEDGRHRLCTDLHAAGFLRRLAVEKLRSRILITSRLVPGELGDPQGGHAETFELGGLERPVAVALLRACGVEGESAELEAAANATGLEPLSLRLLAGLLTGGSSRGAVLEARDLPEKRDRDDIVAASITALDGQWQSWLGHLATFRGLITPEQAAMFNPFGTIMPVADLIEPLVRRSLVMRDEPSGLLQLHPVVRRAARQALPDRRAAHEHLAGYFGQVTLPQQVLRVDELLPAIEHFLHLLGAGRHQAAHGLLRGRLIRPLRERFNDQQMLVRLLRALLDGQEPPLEDTHDRAWVVDCLARALGYSGETRQALALLAANIPSFESPGAEEPLAMLVARLAGVQARLGLLRESGASLGRLVELTAALGRGPEHAVARNRLGLLLATRGAYDEAMAELDSAFDLAREAGDRQVQGLSFCYYARRALLMGDHEAALDAARKARALVEQMSHRSEPNEDDYVRSGGLLGAAYVACAERDEESAASHLRAADRYLTDALSRCRRNDLVGFEPNLLLTLARWHRASGRTVDARTAADQALVLADRCEYRLEKAEVHAFLARMLLDARDAAGARAEAERARAGAECDGDPWSFRSVLDAAEGILAEIAASPPRAREGAGGEGTADGTGGATGERSKVQKARARKPASRKTTTRKPATGKKPATRKRTTSKPSTRKSTTKKRPARDA